MKGMAWNVLWWCILTTSRNYLILVTVCWFSYICHNFDEAKLVRFGFQILGIVWIMHGKNGLKCEMLMYPDRLQKLFDFGHGLVVFLLLAYFWLSEMGHVPDMSYYTRNIMGFITRGPFGLRVLSSPVSVCVCVYLCVCQLLLVRTITHHTFQLDSPDLDEKMQNILL